MAFTGSVVVTKVADTLARITGISLDAGAAGTIGPAGSGADVKLPAGCQWEPYDSIDLAEAVEVSILPAVPLTVAKAASPFLITITNDQAAALGAQAYVGKMSRVAAQVIADNTPALIDFDTQIFDVGDVVVLQTGVYHFTARVAGKYTVTANVEWRSSIVADGLFQMRAMVNGAAVTSTRSSVDVQTVAAVPRSNTIATVLDLAAGDVVTFEVAQVSGAPQTIGPAEATFALIAGAAPGDTPNLEIYCRFH